MRVLMRLLAILSPLLVASVPAAARDERPPNIILILADDLGYGELGAYGQSKIRTPHIDRLASEGIAFDRFYASSAVCAPTRASLMTGLHTGHLPIRGNREVGGWGIRKGEGQMPLPASAETIAEMLKQRGYATGVFGKWGLGGPGTEGHPLAQGFDRFFGMLCQRIAHSFTPPYLWDQHDVYLLPENGYINPHQKLSARPTDDAEFARFTGPMYAPELMVERAEAFIAQRKSEPFFLYFPTALPHLALQAPNEWIDRYPREWDEAPYLGDRGYLPSLRPRATYAAMISYLDHSVGRLVEAVERAGLTERTLIIVTSDNGAAWNIGGLDPDFFASNGTLRGHKAQLYEGGIRVPFIARWPGRIRPGARSSHQAALYDLKATIAEIAGRKDGHATGDGISFVAELTGNGKQRSHDHLYFEYPEGAQWQAVIRGRYKAIRPNLKGNGLATELYDLEADPGERANLAEELPAVLEELTAIMNEDRVPSAEFPIPALDATSVAPR